MTVNEVLEKALLKKAKGYSAKEVTEEYSSQDELIKRRVSVKHYPPDISAIKAILELSDDKEISQLSERELESERDRLEQLALELLNNDKKLKK